jgi:hypothetical protein
VNNTTNVTNYVTVNNYIINRSVDVTRVERAAGRPIARVQARDVLRQNASITTVDQGNRLQQNERRNHGGNRNASARDRIVALPESRARAISPPVGGGQDRDRIDRVIGTPGGRDNGKGNDAGPRDRAGPDNDRGRSDRPGLGNGPGRPAQGNANGNGNGPDLQRERALERRTGPNGPGPSQSVVGQSQTINRQQDRGPAVEPARPQARQQAPQNEGPPQGGGNNKRIDRTDQPDREQKGGGREGATDRRDNRNR